MRTPIRLKGCPSLGAPFCISMFFRKLSVSFRIMGGGKLSTFSNLQRTIVAHTNNTITMEKKDMYQTPEVEIVKLCPGESLLQSSVQGFKNDEDFNPGFFGLS